MMLVLINPPDPPGAVVNRDTMGGFGERYAPDATNAFPPLDLVSTAGLLRARGAAFKVIDCPGLRWGVAELLAEQVALRPAAVALRTATASLAWDLLVGGLIKAAVGCQLLLFGPAVTLAPDAALTRSEVDGVVVGEPEETLAAVARDGLGPTAGLHYRDHGRVVTNPPRAPVIDLDQLPFPAWDLLPYRSYDGSALMRELRPFVTVASSRGCPHGCHYCPYPIAQGRRLRVRSPASVVDELHWLSTRLGVRAVLFRDPEFAAVRQRAVAICHGLIARGVRVAWRCETRVEDLDDELLGLFARAGCIGVNFGIESAAPAVLVQVGRKGVAAERVRQVVATCRRHAIEPFCFFIVGLPGDTRETIHASVTLALSLRLRFCQFSVATPYPGTELRQWAESRRYLSADSNGQPTMRNELLTAAELRALQREAQVALDMQWPRPARRLAGHARALVGELARWAWHGVTGSR